MIQLQKILLLSAAAVLLAPAASADPKHQCTPGYKPQGWGINAICVPMGKADKPANDKSKNAGPAAKPKEASKPKEAAKPKEAKKKERPKEKPKNTATPAPFVAPAQGSVAVDPARIPPSKPPTGVAASGSSGDDGRECKQVPARTATIDQVAPPVSLERAVSEIGHLPDHLKNIAAQAAGKNRILIVREGNVLLRKADKNWLVRLETLIADSEAVAKPDIAYLAENGTLSLTRTAASDVGVLLNTVHTGAEGVVLNPAAGELTTFAGRSVKFASQGPLRIGGKLVHGDIDLMHALDVAPDGGIREALIETGEEMSAMNRGIAGGAGKEMLQHASQGTYRTLDIEPGKFRQLLAPKVNERYFVADEKGVMRVICGPENLYTYYMLRGTKWPWEGMAYRRE